MVANGRKDVGFITCTEGRNRSVGRAWPGATFNLVGFWRYIRECCNTWQASSQGKREDGQRAEQTQE
jgi:hypothetical protein